MIDIMPTALLSAIQKLYEPCEIKFNNFKPAVESNDYEACSFKLNELHVQFRSAKITPTKIGQFVAIWKRDKSGKTIPFDETDELNLLIISTRYHNRVGQFIFPKRTLLSTQVISENFKGGKRGMRVYPPWEKAINKQAQQTQKWQVEYFVEISASLVDLQKVKDLIK